MILPETLLRAVAFQGDVDAIPRRHPRAGQHRDAEWELRLTDTNGCTIRTDASNVSNRRAASDVKNANERKEEDEHA